MDAYRELLQPLVRDKQLLDLVVQNTKKLKNRFGYVVDVEGKTDSGRREKLVCYKDVGRLTIEELVQQYWHKLSLRSGRVIGYDAKKHASLLGLSEEAVKQFNTGTITNTVVTIVFRKGNQGLRR